MCKKAMEKKEKNKDTVIFLTFNFLFGALFSSGGNDPVCFRFWKGILWIAGWLENKKKKNLVGIFFYFE